MEQSSSNKRESEYTLFKWKRGWSLPSISPACIQIEALLLFSGLSYESHEVKEPGCAPCENLPALEKEQNLSQNNIMDAKTEFDGTRLSIEFLKRNENDLDSHLNSANQANSKSMALYIEKYLEPATLFGIWGENKGYKEYKKAISKNLPFPLSELVPMMERHRILKILNKIPQSKIYENAVEALDNIVKLLDGKPESKYCFGNVPCALDALIYGHLVFYLSAPSVAPVIRQKIEKELCLKKFVENISAEYFKDNAPRHPTHFNRSEEIEEDTMHTIWSAAAKGQGAAKEEKKEDTPENLKLKKWAKVWLLCTAMVVGVYTWFAPLPIHFIRELENEFDVDEEDENVLQ